MKNKCIKILVAVLVLILGISISIKSNAYEIFKDDIHSSSEDEDISKQYYKGTKTRIRQHISGDDGKALLFCVQGMQNYKATLTRDVRGDYVVNQAYNTYCSNPHCPNHLYVANGLPAPSNDAGTIDDGSLTMEYTRHDEKITDQAFAYLIATAQERGILKKMYTQYAVWALDINKGKKEVPNALATEAINYSAFYNAIHDGGFNLKDETTDEPDVLIDAKNKEYTIGDFSVSYTTGEASAEVQKGEDVDISSEDEEAANGEKATLKKMLDQSKIIYKHINDNRTVNGDSVTYDSNIAFNKKGKTEEYYKIHTDIANNYENYNVNKLTSAQQKLKKAVKALEVKKDASSIEKEISSIKSEISTIEKQIENLNNEISNLEKELKKAKKQSKKDEINEQLEQKRIELANETNKLEQKNDELKKANSRLKAVKARDNINSMKLEPEELTSSDDTIKDAAVQFSYISEVTVIGCDENGKEIKEIASNKINADGSMQKEITIVNGAGDEIQHDITYKNGAIVKNANLPTNGDVFYVRFKMGDKNNDNSIKKIKIRVKADYLDHCDGEIHYYTGTWYKWTWVEYSAEDCSYTTQCPGEPTCTIKEDHVHSTKYNRYWWVLERTPSGEPQKFLGIDFEEGSSESGKVQAKKVWENEKITLGGDGIGITMDLAGYAYLDNPGEKKNETNSLLDNPEDIKETTRETMPGVEVWLYEYAGSDENGNPKDSKLWGITLTDDKGHYEFKGLNSEKKYYVRFVYNGMLYTSVKDYNKDDPAYNSEAWKQTSKAHEIERDKFNEKFAEIGSYPENYEIPEENRMFGNKIGDYNIVFTQDEIRDVFKEISRIMAKNGDGNLKRACEEVAGNDADEMTMRKVQFAVDCRINSRTDTKETQFKNADKTYVYPVYENFVITRDATNENNTITIAGKTYNFIYPGQRYINYGMASRSTVDLTLVKDAVKAVVSINGKSETYTYRPSETIKTGLTEDDYIAALRLAYVSDMKFSEMNFDGKYDGKSYKDLKETVLEDENQKYILYTRKSDVTNGKTTVEPTIESQLNDVLKSTDLNGDLDIEITYRIRVHNESPTIAAVTEIVDYYDKDYEFVKAYIGDKDGNRLDGEVKYSDGSKYSKNTEYTDTSKYKTKYLIPTEQKLADNSKDYGKDQYIFVTMSLGGKNKAGQKLVENGILNGKEILTVNIAEINGYKTYNKNDDKSPGLIDKDSIPGNYNLKNKLGNKDNIKDITRKDREEDDTGTAQAIQYTIPGHARTISGVVFEDKAVDEDGNVYQFADKDTTIKTGKVRNGNGEYNDNGNNKDRPVEGVKVELYEVKNNNLYKMAETTTDNAGNYIFSGFIPGNYTVKYTYGHNDKTVLINNTNKVSYNGQDYQSTKYTNKEGSSSTFKKKYENKKYDITYYYNNDEQKTPIYWYTEYDTGRRVSDAQDDIARKNEVMEYSKTEYGKAIINHKAEVFNSYQSNQGRAQNKLVEELEDYTHRYAYTPEVVVEVEYAKTDVTGNQDAAAYKHDIQGIDFGIVERPRSELVIDQDIERIKVVASDKTTVLFDSTGPTSNLQWIKGQEINNGQYGYKGGKIDGYDKQELVNIIMDEELISGAQLEVTYKFTVTNNSEKDTVSDADVTTKAKTIVNYVANNLTFDEKANAGKWKVVKASDIQGGTEQYDKKDTFITNTTTDEDKVDLSTQAVILQTINQEEANAKGQTDYNKLTDALKPGEQATETLVLTKELSASSALDDLTYTNLAEIVEIDNTVGRYDHGATPGNQSLEKNPQEHDAAGASKYDTITDGGNTPDDPPDGVIIITPPTGSNYIYYVIGITSAVILAVGVYLIKKFVIDRK